MVEGIKVSKLNCTQLNILIYSSTFVSDYPMPMYGGGYGGYGQYGGYNRQGGYGFPRSTAYGYNYSSG